MKRSDNSSSGRCFASLERSSRFVQRVRQPPSIPRGSGDAFGPGSGIPRAPQPSGTHPPPPSLRERLKHNVFPPSNPRSRRDAQLRGLAASPGCQELRVTRTRHKEHGESCSLLVLWSLAVINMGGSGWCPGPWWEPSLGARLSPHQARHKLAASCARRPPAPPAHRPCAGSQRLPWDAPIRSPGSGEGEEEAGGVSWAGRRQSRPAQGAAHSSAEGFRRWGAQRGWRGACGIAWAPRFGRLAAGELRAS